MFYCKNMLFRAARVKKKEYICDEKLLMVFGAAVMVAIVQNSCTKEKIIKEYERIVEYDTMRETLLMNIDSIMAVTLTGDTISCFTYIN